MTTGTIEQPTQSHPARRLALDPYVMRVRSLCLENARIGRQRPISLRLGYQKLTLAPPEFALILRSAGAGEEDSTPEDGLPLEILALLTKSLEDLAKLRAAEDPTSRAVFALQAELMLDSALGAALLAEIKPRIDELTLFDEKELVRALGKLRDLLCRTIADISTTISESERRRATDLAESFTDRPLVPAQSPAIAPPVPARAEPPKPTPAKRPARAEPKPQRSAESADSGPKGLSSTAFLGAGLFLALAIWLGLFVLPRFRGPEIESLTRSDFDDLTVLSDVEARPPSLFVQVDRVRWKALDDAGRREVVEKVSRVLSRNDYSGALFETENGRPVAQWLRDRGAQLIGETPPAPPASSPISPE